MVPFKVSVLYSFTTLLDFSSLGTTHSVIHTRYMFLGAPRLSLTKYFHDHFLQVSLTILWLGCLDVAIAKNSQNCMLQIYSTRLHASFANFFAMATSK